MPHLGLAYLSRALLPSDTASAIASPLAMGWHCTQARSGHIDWDMATGRGQAEAGNLKQGRPLF
jgi:hypothetical protein